MRRQRSLRAGPTVSFVRVPAPPMPMSFGARGGCTFHAPRAVDDREQRGDDATEWPHGLKGKDHGSWVAAAM